MALPLLELEVPLDRAYVPSYVEPLLTFLEKERVEADVSYRVQVVLEELLLNLVDHSQGGSRRALLRVEVQGKDRLDVVVVDDANPFPPVRAPRHDPSKPLEERRPGGMGLFLVARFSDSYAYESRDGRNTFTATFRTRNDADA